MRNKKGFTLIELLVVIAIIGVLSSIVLSSLNSSRNKAADAAIKTALSHLRNSAELMFYNNSESYGANFNFTSNCDTLGSQVPPTHVFRDTDVQKVINDAVSKSGYGSGSSSAKCNVSGGTSYVLAVKLKSDSSKGLCVDSSKNLKIINWTDYAANRTACP